MTRALPTLAAILTLSTAHAHQAPSGWTYDAWCCNTMDCAKIPARSVKPGPNGYTVTLNPGDHPMIVAPQSYFIPYGKERPSGDMDFHACILPGQLDVMRCFYAPEGGV
jgi:hypothetical protein